METKFQTSFIPKGPLPTIGSGGSVSVPHKKHLGSIFTTISVLIFVLSLLSVGGVYLWKNYLLAEAETYKKDLITREQQFNVDQIAELKANSDRIVLAKQLLASHLATSQLFSVISAFTSEHVRFTSMEVSVPPSLGAAIQLTLTGYGQSFSTVAFQSDVLSQLDRYGLSKIVKNPIISSPALNKNGTVSFNLAANIDPRTILYEKPADQAPAAPAADTGTTGQ